MPSPPTLNAEHCRARQARLVEVLKAREISQFLATRSDTVTWLTGVYLGPLLEVAALLDDQGELILVLPANKAETPAAANRVVTYEAKWLSTMRNDQAYACLAALSEKISPRRTIGAEFSRFVRHGADAWPSEWIDLEPTIWSLRRRKDADELAVMAYANTANRRMYEHARQVVRPGLSELDLYNQLHAVATDTLGEPLTYLGQDFRSGARGGPPRQRKCEPGELYILDLGVGYRGYYSDNARTLAVGGDPSAAQRAAWQAVAEVFGMIERDVRPGISCRDVFERAQGMLDQSAPWVFNHHLGHGVGLAPHEGPHLNPNWDDTFEVGDFFTAEPGLYHDDLRHGVRLEQNYVVTETGVELLTDWPLEMC